MATVQGTFYRMARPGQFLALVMPFLPVMVAMTALLWAVGLYLSLLHSPVDYQQGQTVRIMYIHVPAALMGLMVYASMAGAAGVAYIWRHPLADIYCRAIAPVGACLTLLCLITGSLWGQPMWGTWWVWDARLTSVLVLFFLYLGYMALVAAYDDPARGEAAGRIILLVGVVNLPIIKFSVDWWNTLHQPASISKFGASNIDPSMLRPLLVMAAGFLMMVFCLGCYRMQTEILARRLRQRLLVALPEVSS